MRLPTDGTAGGRPGRNKGSKAADASRWRPGPFLRGRGGVLGKGDVRIYLRYKL